MFCIAAFIILGILSVFSATHRELAKEAYACVFKRVTFKPCDSDFQSKTKGMILNWLMTKNMRLASLFNKYSETLAWLFVVLSITTAAYSAYGLYNYFVHGSCTPENPEQCQLNKVSFLENIRLTLDL